MIDQCDSAVAMEMTAKWESWNNREVNEKIENLILVLYFQKLSDIYVQKWT